MKRACSTIALFVTAIFAPWWIFLSAIFAATIYFPRYTEIMFLGLFADLLYGIPIEKWDGFEFLMLSSSILIYLGGSRIRNLLRLNFNGSISTHSY